tara:strand:- start:1014 stop:1397 length:384 start_codon:yes stop_codon:yes gene_type:complete
MPLYDYGCKECGDEFREMARIDDRFVACSNPCSACGGELTLLIGAPALVDSVIINRTKPDDGYKEVIEKINEREGIKGTRYELEPQLEHREKNKGKALTQWEIKETVNDKLKAKKGRGNKIPKKRST